MQARREGANAILECRVCRSTRRIGEGEFAAMNAFVDQHRACCR